MGIGKDLGSNPIWGYLGITPLKGALRVRWPGRDLRGFPLRVSRGETLKGKSGEFPEFCPSDWILIY
jgi:hypothetical protein